MLTSVSSSCPLTAMHDMRIALFYISHKASSSVTKIISADRITAALRCLFALIFVIFSPNSTVSVTSVLLYRGLNFLLH